MNRIVFVGCLLMIYVISVFGAQNATVREDELHLYADRDPTCPIIPRVSGHQMYGETACLENTGAPVCFHKTYLWRGISDVNFKRGWAQFYDCQDSTRTKCRQMFKETRSFNVESQEYCIEQSGCDAENIARFGASCIRFIEIRAPRVPGCARQHSTAIIVVPPVYDPDTCVKPKNIGEACSVDADCYTQVCLEPSNDEVTRATGGICTEQVNDEPCLVNDDCISGYCDTDNTCQTSGSGCFVGTTPILLADGTTKLAQDIKIGDEVRSRGGVVNSIAFILKKKAELGKLVSVNGSPAFLTPDHPLIVPSVSIDQIQVYDVNLLRANNPVFARDPKFHEQVTQMKVGGSVFQWDAAANDFVAVPITSLELVEVSTDTDVYAFHAITESSFESYGAYGFLAGSDSIDAAAKDVTNYVHLLLSLNLTPELKRGYAVYKQTHPAVAYKDYLTLVLNEATVDVPALIADNYSPLPTDMIVYKHDWITSLKSYLAEVKPNDLFAQEPAYLTFMLTVRSTVNNVNFDFLMGVPTEGGLTFVQNSLLTSLNSKIHARPEYA